MKLPIRSGQGKRVSSRLLMTAACALSLSLPLYAQGRGGGGGGEAGGRGMQRSPGGGPGTMGAGNAGGRGGIPPSAGMGRGNLPGGGNGGSGSLQTGPVGRWWDDKNYSNALGLKPEQKKRMDAIFNGNRGELTERMGSLRQEEAKLEAATREEHLSQESIFGQMDRVAAARYALEQTNTRLLESLRKELDPEQLTRMQTLK